MKKARLIGILLTLVVVLSSCAASSSTPASVVPSSVVPSSAAPASVAPSSAAPVSSAAPAAPAKPAYPNPSKNFYLGISSAAGGSNDIGCRMIIPYLEKAMGGCPVVPENLEGGSYWAMYADFWNNPGNADGYHVMTVTTPNVFSYMNKATNNDKTLDDFKLLCNVVSDQGLFAVRADDERFKDVNNIKEFADWLKAHPDQQILATYHSKGGGNQLGYLKFVDATGVTNLPGVSMIGVAESLPALLGGHSDVYVGFVGDIWVNYDKGEVKVLGIMDDKRSKFMPDVPTCEEVGIPIYNLVSRGYFVHSNTDPAIYDQLLECFRTACNEPQYFEDMNKAGFTPDFIGGKDYEEFMERNRQDYIKLLPLIGY